MNVLFEVENLYLTSFQPFLLLSRNFKWNGRDIRELKILSHQHNVVVEFIKAIA